LQAVTSNTIVQGPAVDVSTKISGTVKVRLGRTSNTTLGGAVELRVEGTGLGHGGGNTFWVAISPWTSSNHGNAPSQANVGSTPAANASALDGTWTGITAADGLVHIYDTNDATRSEWARILSVTGSVLTFTNTLGNIHTATTNKVVDQAEEWDIPVNLRYEESIRFSVDTAKNAVTHPVVVQAILITEDATYYS
jgi:hypothetical protein